LYVTFLSIIQQVYHLSLELMHYPILYYPKTTVIKLISSHIVAHVGNTGT